MRKREENIYPRDFQWEVKWNKDYLDVDLLPGNLIIAERVDVF